MRSGARRSFRGDGASGNEVLALMPAGPVVKLQGEIDAYSARVACRVLDAVHGPAVIDLSGVRLLCAAGLSELARVAARAGRRVVTLRGAPPHVRRVLAIARFHELFLIED
jgi:anti-anti-sigma factor